MKTLIIASFLATAIAISPMPASTAPTAAQSPSHICMARVSKGNGGRDADFKIYVRASKRAAAKARGYRSIKCGKRAGERSEYIEEMCGFAANAPESVQAEFKRKHGATPRQLCQVAK